jgi:hydrogenase-4 membrane subunit HyfE
LNLLAETGLLGTAAFLILWGTIVWTLIRLRAWNGLVFVGIAFLLNLFDYTFFSAEVYYPLWVGIAWAILQAEKDKAHPVTSTPLNRTDPDKLGR